MKNTEIHKKNSRQRDIQKQLFSHRGKCSQKTENWCGFFLIGNQCML